MISQFVKFDTKAITPGCQFLKDLGDYLIKFIKNYEGFKDIQVIFSGYNTPEEGEHKIRKFIKKKCC